MCYGSVQQVDTGTRMSAKHDQVFKWLIDAGRGVTTSVYVCVYVSLCACGCVCESVCVCVRGNFTAENDLSFLEERAVCVRLGLFTVVLLNLYLSLRLPLLQFSPRGPGGAPRTGRRADATRRPGGSVRGRALRVVPRCLDPQ